MSKTKTNKTNAANAVTKLVEAAKREDAAKVATPVEAKPVTSSGLKIQKDRVTANGVTRPSAGGKCDAVWAECDRLQAAGILPSVEALRTWATANNHNINNAQIELYRWRTFNGIRGRQPKAPAPKPEASQPSA